MTILHLRPQKVQLRAVQAHARDWTKVCGEVSGCDGRDQRGDVGECGVEGWDWCAPEVVTAGNGLHLVEGCVSSSDDCHWAGGKGGSVRG